MQIFEIQHGRIDDLTIDMGAALVGNLVETMVFGILFDFLSSILELMDKCIKIS